MAKLAIFAILLVTTLAVPTWGRLGHTKINEMELLDEVMKMEIIQKFKEGVVAVEEPPLKTRLQGCTGVGENCVFIPCCPTSNSGYPVTCSRGPYNAVCVELVPSPWDN
ncbi:hypothetical protein SOVF_072680 [Spinacia oleracea]|uniref:Uncharacterized protein LOC110778272 n=1 Tax=Spinacia oleracea TaxID=3562 RepID=A0A9R0HXD8_SPIOL|nr:uncharacterized protein LOC110778272 [Spinacia oleracea]XP_056689240.1 uncharacterized protein LOC130463958 [Spinacia oleracea]KNA18239.1 hypothetical protein SOVF_072680 [Spinacia oleracea]